MDFLRALTECLLGQTPEGPITLTSRTTPIPPDIDLKAHALIAKILQSPAPSADLHHAFTSEPIHTTSWYSSLAEAILKHLASAFEAGAAKAPVIQEAFDRAVGEAWAWSKEHPVWATIIAIGVLVVIAPWVLEAVGFGELGPIEGM